MNIVAVLAINAKTELTRINHGAFSDQLNLILSSGGEIDLVDLRQLNAITLTSSGTIRLLTQLLQGHGKETCEAISKGDWGCYYVDGEIMVVPSNKDKTFQMCILTDKAVCDELDIPYRTNVTLNEIRDYLVCVKEAYPGIYPLVTEVGGGLHNHPGSDELGNNFGVTTDIYNNDLVVENLFTSDLFIDLCQQVWDWTQEGLIIPDGVSNMDMANSLMAAGRAFTRINIRKLGYESERGMQTEKGVVSLSFMEPFTVTGAVSTTHGWAIPYSSKYPEEVMQLSNVPYTNPELANTTCNSVENKHWVYTDENKTNVKYLDGKIFADVSHGRTAYIQSDQQITIP